MQQEGLYTYVTLIVTQNKEQVEIDLRSGRFVCPDCGESLRPHGHGRTRFVNSLNNNRIEISPRRARCNSCKVTHVLLPENLLIRRVNTVEVIGSALLNKSQGHSIRSISEVLSVPFTTVRGWIRRFNSKADEIKSKFLSLALKSDPNLNNIPPTRSPFNDAICVIGTALIALKLRIGETGYWHAVSRITKGELLFNTNSP